MAANNISSKRAGKIVDYKQLNALSSVVLYDTGKKKKNASFYEVERVITRRRVCHVSCVFNSYYSLVIYFYRFLLHRNFIFCAVDTFIGSR